MARVVQQLNDDLFGEKVAPTITLEQEFDQQYDDLWKRLERGSSD
jgi:hypothetical protein